jgi:peptidoglycan/xylan/chitin deacetylase (PgdA/CDA1 family)
MYHFVGSEEDPQIFGGTRGISAQDLENQIKYLFSKGYKSITAAEIFLHLDSEVPLPEDAFYLTFDDGIKQHYSNVLPVLKKYDLEATFFIPTLPLLEHIFPELEKQRLLQYTLFSDYSEFLDEFCSKCRQLTGDEKAFNPTPQNIKASEDYLPQFGFYEPNERYYRRLRNEIIDADLFSRVIHDIFSEFYSEDYLIIEDYYLSASDIRGMKSQGMIIGGHSHTHQFMDRLTKSEIHRELSVSHSYLATLTDSSIELFAYPFGVYNDTVKKCLSEVAVRCAFDTETGTGEDRFNLHRYDISDLSRQGFFQVK